MTFVGNITDVVQILTASVQPYILDIVLMFVVVVVATLGLEYFHNRHVEQLGKQMADTTTLAVNSIQNLITMEITGNQARQIVESHNEDKQQSTSK